MPAAVRVALDGSVRGSTYRADRFQLVVDGREFAISEEGFRMLATNPPQRLAFIRAATDFRAWLRHWQFLDQESGTVRVLGESLWPAQEAFIAAAESDPWLFFLKSRQIGETTIGVAYDAWVARFRDQNARVHVFSSGDDAAKEVLDTIRFGLERLPPSMRLPMHATTRSIRMDTGDGGRAFIRSYPSTRAASRGSTCNHLHLDEWSAQVDPARVYAATAPTVAPGGTFHILTTETVGPESDTARYYRRCETGDGTHRAVFVSALSRPDRDEAWLEVQRRSMTPDDFNREYPQSAAQALEAAGERYFRASDVDATNEDCEPLQERAGTFVDYRGRERKRRYAAGWDIAQKVDATVGVVVDHTDDSFAIAHYVYLPSPSEPYEIRAAIEHVYARFPCLTLVEENAMGFTILRDLNIPEDRKRGFVTSVQHKPRILAGLYSELAQQSLSFPHEQCPELAKELYGFRLPDTSISQDTVMALAIAVESVRLDREKAPGTYRVLQATL